MPSGRDVYTTSPYVPPVLDAEILARMRAPPEPSESKRLANDDNSSSNGSSDERSGIPGAFPGPLGTNPKESNYY